MNVFGGIFFPLFVISSGLQCSRVPCRYLMPIAYPSMKSISKTLFTNTAFPYRLVLLAMPILFHLGLLLYFSLNIPWIDDFYWYFGFLKKMDGSTTGLESFKNIITPYNNHWHIIQRLFFVSIIKMLGSINMAWVSFLGNALFAGLFYFLFLPRKAKLIIPAGTIAAAWLFFQPVSHYNFFECAFFNLPVLLLSFLSIRAFSDKRNSGFFWGVLATFSNGNGLLVWPVGVLMAIWHRDWKRALQCGIIFAGFAALYLFLSKGTSGPGKFSIQPIGDLLIYFIQLCGSISNGVEAVSPLFQNICGFAMLAGVVFITKRALQVNEKLYFFMLFLLMSVGIIAMTRKEVDGFSAQIVNHYLLFPQLLLGCLVYFLIEEMNPKPGIKAVVIFAAIALSSVNYALKIPDLNGHHALKIANLMNYESQGKWILHPPIQGKEEYKMVNEVTHSVVAGGEYILPDFEKIYLNESCSYTGNPDGSIVVSAELNHRMLNRVILVELTHGPGLKTYMPVDPYSGTLPDWFRLKKNRRIDATLFINLLNEPFEPKSISACKLMTVR
jgi:hypothetical protein